MQPRNPVVVILHRGKAELRHQLRIGVVDAVHLVHRHLPLLEVRRLLVLGKPRSSSSRLVFSCVGQAPPGQPRPAACIKFCSRSSPSLTAFTE